MVPEDLPRSSLLSALDGARIIYFDMRLHETALVVACEVILYYLRVHSLRLKHAQLYQRRINFYIVFSAKSTSITTVNLPLK